MIRRMLFAALLALTALAILAVPAHRVMADGSDPMPVCGPNHNQICK